MSELPYANRALRVGVQLQPQHADYADLRRAVAAAEEAGVDVILTWITSFRSAAIQKASISSAGRC